MSNPDEILQPLHQDEGGELLDAEDNTVARVFGVDDYPFATDADHPDILAASAAFARLFCAAGPMLAYLQRREKHLADACDYGTLDRSDEYREWLEVGKLLAAVDPAAAGDASQPQTPAVRGELPPPDPFAERREEARRWREARELTGKGGYVVFVEGHPHGWCVRLVATLWTPGCVAVPEDGGEIFVACGHPRAVADSWRPLAAADANHYLPASRWPSSGPGGEPGGGQPGDADPFAGLRKAARKYRADRDLHATDGAVIFFQGKANGWSLQPNASHWEPGCVAVFGNGGEGPVLVSHGGNVRDGAREWRPLDPATGKAVEA